jgi:hypothetical protein
MAVLFFSEWLKFNPGRKLVDREKVPSKKKHRRTNRRANDRFQEQAEGGRGSVCFLNIAS